MPVFLLNIFTVFCLSFDSVSFILFLLFPCASVSENTCVWVPPFLYRMELAFISPSVIDFVLFGECCYAKHVILIIYVYLFFFFHSHREQAQIMYVLHPNQSSLSFMLFAFPGLIVVGTCNFLYAIQLNTMYHNNNNLNFLCAPISPNNNYFIFPTFSQFEF